MIWGKREPLSGEGNRLEGENISRDENILPIRDRFDCWAAGKGLKLIVLTIGYCKSRELTFCRRCEKIRIRMMNFVASVWSNVQ